jgi:formylglycine-generating enzyme required for sulfatase activity
MDRTEVTRAAYARWLRTSPDPEHEIRICSDWKVTFVPACDWPPGPADGTLPVTCVDWCDAFAYCKANGQRLCGGIGGGPARFGSSAEPAQGQWGNACSSGGKYAYAFGATFDPARCNGAAHGKGTVVPVGSLSTCRSSDPPYAGIHDLTGNVWEWEDACHTRTGMNDACNLRGGSYYSDARSLRCASAGVGMRYSRSRGIGFRCCS